ncbi:MAG TPA: alpha-L-arabinofuranosidase C-terminal domain-containing protein [Candidatus Limnocylindria bacterium]|nr:alpha-L-arabinofuranosidase C-terminal domain-containing protein [Candidatus Limnocylindria bacterium]
MAVGAKHAKVTLGARGAKIDRNIYGHFAEHLGRCIYDGLYVGKGSPIPNEEGMRLDVVEALRKIKIPVLRWPGGCFADEYHWMDGIGPQGGRKRMINTHWGGVVEDNSFGTHEFFRLCEMLDTAPYICGNVGSGTVREMSEWVEYMNFRGESPMSALRRANGREEPFGIKYFGVGNENWNCGGRMRAEHYADLYRNYATYARSYEGFPLYRVAAGPRGANYHWTEVLMREASHFMDGFGLHYYTRVGDKVIVRKLADGNDIYLRDESRSRGSATEFGEKDWFGIMKAAWFTDELVQKHSEIMDKYDPDKKVALIVDEWGTWFDAEPGTNPGFLYQQNTLRDAVSAAISLNVFNNHADRVRMANIAQTVNVLQAVILTQEDRMVLTPTYHVYDMFTCHHDAALIHTEVQAPEYAYGSESVPGLVVSASRDAAGTVHLTVANPDPANAVDLDVDLGEWPAGRASGDVITAPRMNALNDFGAESQVTVKAFDGITLHENIASLRLPPMSVVAVHLGH